VIGAHAGLDYLTRLGFEAIDARQRELNRFVTEALAGERRIHVLGPTEADRRPTIYAFTIDGVDPHDAALFLDEGYRVMVRSGMHCVHSFYARRGLSGNVRASFYFYNDRSDAEALVRGIRELLDRVPARPSIGTSAATGETATPAATGRKRGAGSTAAAARSARPPRRAAPGRAASATGSG